MPYDPSTGSSDRGHYSDYPEYEQLFPPFEHGVSILDLIFNEGLGSFKFMKSFS